MQLHYLHYFLWHEQVLKTTSPGVKPFHLPTNRILRIILPHFAESDVLSYKEQFCGFIVFVTNYRIIEMVIFHHRCIHYFHEMKQF